MWSTCERTGRERVPADLHGALAKMLWFDLPIA
jgi:hypothetical protein